MTNAQHIVVALSRVALILLWVVSTYLVISQ
jgi:hypothetical protein